jgi:hypothetical protein
MKERFKHRPVPNDVDQVVSVPVAFQFGQFVADRSEFEMRLKQFVEDGSAFVFVLAGAHPTSGLLVAPSHTRDLVPINIEMSRLTP